MCQILHRELMMQLITGVCISKYRTIPQKEQHSVETLLKMSILEKAFLYLQKK